MQPRQWPRNSYGTCPINRGLNSLLSRLGADHILIGILFIYGFGRLSWPPGLSGFFASSSVGAHRSRPCVSACS